MKNQRLLRIKVGSLDDFAPFQCLVRVVSKSCTIAEPMKPVAPITKTRTLISRLRPRPVEEIGRPFSFMLRNVVSVSIVVNVNIWTRRSPGFSTLIPRLSECVKRSAGLSGGVCRVFFVPFCQTHKNKLEPGLVARG
jgi:hypothetical protein